MSHIPAALSVLFSHYDHRIQIDRVRNKDRYDQAILESAKQFLDFYGPIFACTLPTAEELAADFLKWVDKRGSNAR